MGSGIKVNHTTQTQLDPLPGKFVWNTESLNIYTEKIQSQDTRHKLHLFLNQELDNCNKAVHAFSSLLCETASVSTKFIKGHAQADLSLRWAHMPFCWFCHEAAQLCFVMEFGWSDPY